MTAAVIPGSNIIQVVVQDPRPVRAVRLVASDGTVTEASSLSTDRVYDRGSGSSLGLGLGGFGFGRGGGGGGGVGVGMPLGGSPTQVQSVATASIPLTAPAAYRSDWQRYRIDVLMGDPPQIVSLSAPEPR
ncbi:MAG: hypothetical protein JWL84_5015 [Rhodospirillales bacterium]|nr:hypothetical protein [Rhodospirillales bacterium]